MIEPNEFDVLLMKLSMMIKIKYEISKNVIINALDIHYYNRYRSLDF